VTAHAITTPRPRLLVLRALGLGDLLCAVPALRALARAFPSHYRVLAMPVALAPLVTKIGAVDEVVDADPLAPLDPVLNNAEIAVNLHGSGPQSHNVLLCSRPHRMIAFEHPEVPESRGMPAWNAEEHETQRWCRLLRESGIEPDADDLDLRLGGDSRYRGVIVLHPGAASESRRWPVDRWVRLATTLKEQGHRIVLTGSEQEFRRARMVAKAAHLQVEWVIAGKTRIDELADIVAAARAVVCGDTGIAHLATAVRTPSVILFGPTSPQRWGPPRGRERHRVIWRGTVGDPHANTVDPGLASITVDEVLAELTRLLDFPKAG